MLHLRERWVQYHEIVISSSPKNAPYIPILELIKRIRARVAADECVKIIENDQAAIRISKCKISEKHKVAMLLLQYANKNVTDPTFMHLEKGKLRIEPKLKGEGIAVSAHMAISLEACDDIGIRYPMLLEEVPGLRRSKIMPFFQTEFKLVCDNDYEFNDVLDNNKVKKYYPSIEILAEPTKSLTEDLSEGVVLQGAELVELHENNHVMDEEGYYTVESSYLKIAIDKKASPKDVIKKLRKTASNSSYDNVRLRYKNAGKKQKTAEFGTTQQDLVDALVVRTDKITAAKDLEQCMDDFDGSLLTQLVKLIKAL